MKITVPTVQVAANQPVSLPVRVNHADNLAGLKLVLSYDPDIVTFVRLDKGPKAAPLMHVVNAKTPGRLIVVMAGARGIQGDDFPLAVIHFKTAAKPGRTPVTIEHWELMTDTLKPVKATVTNGAIIVVSPAPAATNNEQESSP